MEKGSSELQQSLEKSNNNEENDAVLNLRGGNDDTPSKAKIGARRKKAEIIGRVRNSTSQ